LPTEMRDVTLWSPAMRVMHIEISTVCVPLIG